MDIIARHLPSVAQAAVGPHWAAPTRWQHPAMMPAMMMATGLGLGLSAITVAVLPLVLAIAIQRRLAAWQWLMALPAIMIGSIIARFLPGGGWLRADLWLMHDVAVAGDAPNLWGLICAAPWIAALPLAGLAVAATIGVGAMLTARLSAQPLVGVAMSRAALLTLTMMPMVMPGMTTAAFAPAAGIALVDAWHQRRRHSTRIAALILAGLTIAVSGQFWGIATAPMIGAIPMLWATALVALTVLRPAANDNPLLARAA